MTTPWKAALDTVKLDNRAGSIELHSSMLSLGLRVELAMLPFGDISFTGNGPEDCPVMVGIEYKKVPDLIKCIGDGRFAGHQLPGLLNLYNYSYLIVEGQYRAGPGGILQQLVHGRWMDAGFGQRKYSYREVESYLTTMELKGGLYIRRTLDQQDTAWSIRALYDWWTKKDWGDHRAHLAFDIVTEVRTAMLVKPGVVRRIAKELPGVGWEKSQAIAAEFKTVIEMVEAEEKRWASIPGIGKVMAKRIRKELGHP